MIFYIGYFYLECFSLLWQVFFKNTVTCISEPALIMFFIICFASFLSLKFTALMDFLFDHFLVLYDSRILDPYLLGHEQFQLVINLWA